MSSGSEDVVVTFSFKDKTDYSLTIAVPREDLVSVRRAVEMLVKFAATFPQVARSWLLKLLGGIPR